MLVKVHEYVYIFLLPKSGYFKDKLRKKRHYERLYGVLMKEVLFHMLTVQIFFSIGSKWQLVQTHASLRKEIVETRLISEKASFLEASSEKKTFINKTKCKSIAANKYLLRKKYISSNIFSLLTDAITARQ